MNTTRPLHILYVGQLNDGATCAHRMRVLKDLGHQITPFNVVDYLESGHWLVRAIRYRWTVGPGIRKINHDLLAAAKAARPDLIWIDKGQIFWPETIRSLKQYAPVIHYNPDDPFGLIRHGWRHFKRAIPEYDVHLVPRAVNVDEYRNAGAKHVARYYWSYHPDIHRPREISQADRQRLGGPVGFIGTYEPPRGEAVYHLARHGIDVRVWGSGWQKFNRSHEHLTLERRSLFDDAYATGLCAFDINLGFLMKANRDLITQRSVEIPACGKFLLAERTSEHLQLFEEGKEAEFFDGHGELLEKTRYYLAHPAERETIAAAGRLRCLRDGYSNHDRLKELLQQVQDVIFTTPKA